MSIIALQRRHDAENIAPKHPNIMPTGLPLKPQSLKALTLPPFEERLRVAVIKLEVLPPVSTPVSTDDQKEGSAVLSNTESASSQASPQLSRNLNARVLNYFKEKFGEVAPPHNLPKPKALKLVLSTPEARERQLKLYAEALENERAKHAAPIVLTKEALAAHNKKYASQAAKKSVSVAAPKVDQQAQARAFLQLRTPFLKLKAALSDPVFKTAFSKFEKNGCNTMELEAIDNFEKAFRGLEHRVMDLDAKGLLAADKKALFIKMLEGDIKNSSGALYKKIALWRADLTKM